jgi:hypothetical protein
MASKNPGNQGSSPPPKAPLPQIAQETPFFIRWARELGIVALFLGGIGVMPFYFWVGVGLVYLGCALGLVDIIFDPQFRQRPKLAITVGSAILALAVGFSLGFVFVNAPLGLSGIATNAEYPDNTVISGIVWRPEFTELDFIIENSTSRPYDDLDLLIRPNFPVAAIAQSSDLSGVRIEDHYTMLSRQILKDASGKGKANPLVLAATDSGYKVRCEHLPAKSTLRLVIAIAEIKWNPNPPAQRPDFGLFDPDYILRYKFDDFSTYWYAHAGSNIYTPRVSPDWVKVDGEYNVLYRTRTVSEKITLPRM